MNTNVVYLSPFSRGKRHRVLLASFLVALVFTCAPAIAQKNAQSQQEGRSTPPASPASPAPIVRQNRMASPISPAMPELTDEMKKRKLKTKVAVMVEVDTYGGHTESIVWSSGDAEVDALILATAHRWRWRYMIVNGIPTKSTVRYHFTLDAE